MGDCPERDDYARPAEPIDPTHPQQKGADIVDPIDSDPMDLAAPKPESSLEHQLVGKLGYFGHFLFVHAGGRGGKQRVLARLYHHDGRLPQRDLIEHSGNSAAALSEVLSKLEAEGLIKRTRSQQDRRQLDVVLTPEGTQIARNIMRGQQFFERQALCVLSDDQKHDLLQTLDLLMDHWNKLEKDPVIEGALRGCLPDSAQVDPQPETPQTNEQKGA